MWCLAGIWVVAMMKDWKHSITYTLMGIGVAVGGSLATLWVFAGLVGLAGEAVIAPMFLVVLPLWHMLAGIGVGWLVRRGAHDRSVWMSPGLYTGGVYLCVSVCLYSPGGDTLGESLLGLFQRALPFALWFLCSWFGLVVGHRIGRLKVSSGKL